MTNSWPAANAGNPIWAPQLSPPPVYQKIMQIADQITAEVKNSQGFGKNDTNKRARLLKRFGWQF
jgi:hypothetical protein